MNKSAFLAALTGLAGVTNVAASPAIIGQNGDWGIYSFVRGGKKTCYVLSVPKRAEPAGADHGKNYFLVAPAEHSDRREPEAIMGYGLKPGSLVELGDKTFRMFAKDDTAWVEDASRAPELMQALRSGSSMTLKATSARGTHTSYTYSLDGIKAALARSVRCR